MSIMLVNPVMAMMYNTKLKRWHPVLFVETPLPGPETPGKPVRHKSKGHHTAGFEKREEAVADAQNMAKRIVDEKMWTECHLAVKEGEDVPWDGEDIPADVAFFILEKDGTARRAM